MCDEDGLLGEADVHPLSPLEYPHQPHVCSSAGRSYLLAVETSLISPDCEVFLTAYLEACPKDFPWLAVVGIVGDDGFDLIR